MKRLSLLRTVGGAATLALALAATSAQAQNRDFNTQRLVLDDDNGNTITLQTPTGPIGGSFTLTFPAAGGTVMTTAAPSGLTAAQLVFGGAGGDLAQDANLTFTTGTGIFNIGAGNFTVDANNGNTAVGGTLGVTGLATLGGGVSVTGAVTLPNDAIADAEVVDALTISGGTVNNSVIGGSTPAAGTFTNLTASGTVTLPAGSITTTEIADGTITTTDISGTAGITDAQVNDNLTISGGTVNNSVIGGSSPAAGTFTNLTANDATTLGSGDGTDLVTVNSGAGTNLVISEAGFDRNSGTDETVAIDNSGAGDVNLLINGATSVAESRLTVNEGHWTSQGTAVTAAGDGTNLATAITVLGTSTDVAGQVTATDNNAGGAGTITVTFAATYTTNPIVVVTPADAAAGASDFYISGVGTGSFVINVPVTANDGSTTYSFTYHVIETD